MNNNSFSLSGAILALTLSLTMATTYGQTRNSIPHDQYQQSETLSVIRYSQRDDNAIQIKQVSRQSFAADGQVIDGSAVYRQGSESDAFSGKVLVTHHGEQQADTDYLSYNALGQVVENRQEDIGNDGQPITQRKQTTTYTLSDQGYRITTRTDTNDGSYAQTLHRDALGRKTCTTDSVHGDNVCLARYTYDDLNHVNTINNDLRGSAESKTYDAEGELLSDSQSEQWTQDGQPIDHRISTQYQYDHVLNQVKSRRQGKLTGQKPEHTGWQTKQLNDAKKVTQEIDSVATANTASDNAMQTNRFATNTTFDNFNQKIQNTSGNLATPSEDLLGASYRYDAQGQLQTATIRARANHVQGNDQDTPINVAYAYGLNTQLVSKQVNGTANYWHDYDSNKQRIVEYRRLDNQGHWVHKIYQHPNGDPYHVNISRWLSAGETITQGNTQESDTLADINGSPKLVSKSILHNGNTIYTTTYAYNRLVNKVSDIKKTQKDGSGTVDEIQATYNPDGSISSQTDTRSSAQQTMPSYRTQYRYYPDSTSDKNQRGRLEKKIDAANVTTTYTYHGGQVFTSVASIKDKPVASVENDTGALNELQKKIHRQGGLNGTLIDTSLYTYADDFQRITDIAYQENSPGKSATSWIGGIHYNYHQNPDDLSSPLSSHVRRKIEYTSNDNAAWYRTDYGYNNRNEVSSVTTQKYNPALGEQSSVTKVHHFDNLGNTLAIVPTAQSQTGKTAMGNLDSSGYQFHYGNFGELTRIDKDLGTSKGISQILHYDHDDLSLHEGNLSTDEAGNTYTYNADNRQVSFHNQATNHTTHYRYGANDIRNSKYDANTVLNYVYEGQHLSNTFESQGKDQGAKVSYIGDDDARIVQFADGATQVNFFAHDKRHSVINNIRIDKDGQQIQTYHYNANGAYTDGTAEQSRALDIRHSAPQFAANHDQETRYNDYKIARYVRVFDGVLARFTTMDYGDKGLQLMTGYQLDGQNLLENSDVGGHKCNAIVAGVLAAVGAMVVTSVLGYYFGYWAGFRSTNHGESIVPTGCMFSGAVSAGIDVAVLFGVGKAVSSKQMSGNALFWAALGVGMVSILSGGMSSGVGFFDGMEEKKIAGWVKNDLTEAFKQEHARIDRGELVSQCLDSFPPELSEMTMGYAREDTKLVSVSRMSGMDSAIANSNGHGDMSLSEIKHYNQAKIYRRQIRKQIGTHIENPDGQALARIEGLKNQFSNLFA